MTSPLPLPYESDNLRAFIRSTSLSSSKLAYVPPNNSQVLFPLGLSRPAAFSRRCPSPYPRPVPVRRTVSFANLLNVFRGPSLSFSTDSLSVQETDSTDANKRPIAVDPHITYYFAGEPSPSPAAFPPRSSSLSWPCIPPKSNAGQEDTTSRSALQFYMDGTNELELAVVAELRETFREWEERFGLGWQGKAYTEPLSPFQCSPPLSPAATPILTPETTLYGTLSPLRSTFSCDSDDEEQSTVRSRNGNGIASPGNIARLTRKLSSAIALGIAQKSPVGKRSGLGS